MIEERSYRLLAALENRAETLLAALHEARVQQSAMQARLAELERRRSELEAHNAELVARAEEALASQRGVVQRCDELERRLAELEANRLELVEENRELDEQNRELEEHNRHLHDKLVAGEPGGGFAMPARRAQGLSALIGHRPRGAARTMPDAPHEPGPGQPAEAEAAAGEPARSPQSDLPIGEAPSPQALLAEWYQRYASTFFKGHTRPLKVGIHEELAAREPWPEKLVRRALACYVNLPRYLKSVREDAERIDLDGQAAGRVDAEAAEHARKKLEQLQANRRKPRAKPQRHPARAEGRQAPGDASPPKKPGRAGAEASAAQAPATLEEKLSALLAKHNGR
ncbi:ProQ/FINO family protein [Halomonas sp. EGI 63088]|uniref:ProQ/FINO family protein n=1 Tax=Halomonas flagellata TaxID=2920385 RepID=A0ABS9RU92_9GAMM|nr:ProQ/FINO family protein [Halomonas flagellata]MCH4563408.1 ProQ/FINO family protein [Halomonas flagellata]